MGETTLLEQLTNRAFSPLVPQAAELGQRVSDSVTTPKLNESKPIAMLKGFAGGAAQGLGGLASELSTPASLATIAMPGGSLVGQGMEAMAGSGIKAMLLRALATGGRYGLFGSDTPTQPLEKMNKRLPSVDGMR